MTKSRAYGSDAQLLAVVETTYGTLPGSGYTKLPFSQSSVGAERPLGYEALLGQGRDAADPFYEAITVAGDVEVPVDLRNLGFWLKGLFGAPATTDNGGGAYTHLFTSGGDLPSLAFELGHTKLTTAKYFRHAGAKLGSLAVAFARSGAAKATIGVIAQGETESGSTIDASPDTLALRRFMQGNGTIKVGGVALANVTGGRISFSNGLAPVETIRDDGKIDGVDETEATAEGSVDLRFSTDTTLSSAIAAETPVALEYSYTIPSTSHHLKFILPRVFLPKKKNEVRGPGAVQVTYDWRAAKDDVAGYLLQVSLKNDVASYA